MAAELNTKLIGDTHPVRPPQQWEEDEVERKVSETAARSIPVSRFHAHQHGSPMKRIFSNADSTRDALRRVPGPLKKRKPGNTVTAATSGTSGCTLLCQSTAADVMKPEARELTGLSEDAPVGYVLKWVRATVAQNEVVASKLASAFGVEAPVMQKVSQDVSSQFVKMTKALSPSFYAGHFQMIAMNRFRGMNLAELCKNGEILKLDQKAWDGMLHTFGKASMFDLFIGNFDRFIRSTRSDTGEFALEEEPKANPGNVLVQMTPKKKNLSSVSCIDNGTAVKTPQKKSAFSEKEEESSTETSKRNYPPTAPEAHAFFKEMLTGDPQLLTAHISEALLNAIQSSLGGEVLEENPEALQKIRHHILTGSWPLLAGLGEGRARLYDSTFLQKAFELSLDASQSLKFLIQENASWLSTK